MTLHLLSITPTDETGWYDVNTTAGTITLPLTPAEDGSFDTAEVTTLAERAIRDAVAAQTGQSASFAVTDEDSLDWYVNRLNTIADTKARLERQHKARIRDLDREAQRLAYVYGAGAQAVTRQLVSALKRGKSVKLASGTVGLRRKAPTLSVADDAAALAWLHAHHPELIADVTEVSLRAAALKRAMQVSDDGVLLLDGEIIDVPGVRTSAASEEFYVSAASERR